MTPRASTARVPARVHLAGNPSDGYGGCVLSTVLPELAAEVTATVADRVSVAGPARSWPTVQALAREAGQVGHESGDRLVTAAVVTLDRVLPVEVARTPVAVTWSTSIPRSVGLGGSSAIVLAAMRAVLDVWGAGLDDADLAAAALQAEHEELGIAAGIADRTTQAVAASRGGAVVVRTDSRAARPTLEVVDVAAPVEVLVLWNLDAGGTVGRLPPSVARPRRRRRPTPGPRRPRRPGRRRGRRAGDG